MPSGVRLIETHSTRTTSSVRCTIAPRACRNLLSVSVSAADCNGPRPAAPLSCPPLNLLASQHVSEDEEACRLPPQRRATSQVMRHWAPHMAIADNAPKARQRHLDALHKAQAWDAISRTKAGESGHSILQSDVSDGEEIECEPSKRWKTLLPCILPVLLPAAQAQRSIVIHMAGGHVVVQVLSVHWCAHSQAATGCLASACLPLQSAHH